MINDKTSITILFDEIRSFCQQHADAAHAEKYRRYFAEGYDAYGLEQNIMEPQRDIWLKQYSALGLDGFLQLGDLLVETGKYEQASFALWFVEAFHKKLTPATFDHLGRWLDNGICNWAHTDMLSGNILHRFFTSNVVPLNAFSNWRCAPSRWKRRSVPVTLIKVLKAGAPLEDCLNLIGPMMDDKEKVVHQGLGWFLREAWKRQPAPVETFLLAWKDTCARLIIQYATEKMTPEQKQAFRRIKG